jgi:hypothetical protein
MFAAEDRLTDDAVYPRRPGGSDGPAPISSNLRQYSERRSLVFSRLRTLFPAHGFQFLYCQSLPHSLQQERKLTPAFPITPGLFLRPFTQERKSSPVFSCACARFCRNGRYHKKFVPHIDGQPCGLSSQRPSPAPEGPCPEQDLSPAAPRERHARQQPSFGNARSLFALWALVHSSIGQLQRSQSLAHSLEKPPGRGGSQLQRSRPARTLRPEKSSCGNAHLHLRQSQRCRPNRQHAGDKRVWALLGATQ